MKAKDIQKILEDNLSHTMVPAEKIWDIALELANKIQGNNQCCDEPRGTVGLPCDFCDGIVRPEEPVPTLFAFIKMLFQSTARLMHNNELVYIGLCTDAYVINYDDDNSLIFEIGKYKDDLKYYITGKDTFSISTKYHDKCVEFSVVDITKPLNMPNSRGYYYDSFNLVRSVCNYKSKQETCNLEDIKI